VDVNLHKVARKAICDAVNRGNVKVIGITATPKPLEKLECCLYCVPLDRANLRHFTAEKEIRYIDVNTVIDKITPGMRGGLYTPHVMDLITLGDKFRARGFNPLMLWSLSYEKQPLTTEQLKARKYIIDNEAVPDEYDIFLFNATAETSINLYSHMDFFIAHSTGETSIEQSRGRYRGDLQTLFIRDMRSIRPIPDHFLNVPRDRTELKGLRDYLGIKKDNDKRHEISIDDMLREISKNGYNVEPIRKNQKDYFIIRKE